MSIPAAATTATFRSGLSALLVSPRAVNSLSTAVTINWLMIGLRATIPLSQPKVLKLEKFAVESTSTLTFWAKTAGVLRKRIAIARMIDDFIDRSSNNHGLRVFWVREADVKHKPWGVSPRMTTERNGKPAERAAADHVLSCPMIATAAVARFAGYGSVYVRSWGSASLHSASLHPRLYAVARCAGCTSASCGISLVIGSVKTDSYCEPICDGGQRRLAS